MKFRLLPRVRSKFFVIYGESIPLPVGALVLVLLVLFVWGCL